MQEELYAQKQKHKIEWFNVHRVTLFQLLGKEQGNISDSLSRQLLKFSQLMKSVN